MALEDDGNMGEDAVALFGSSVAPINLDVGATEGGVGDGDSNSNSIELAWQP